MPKKDDDGRDIWETAIDYAPEIGGVVGASVGGIRGARKIAKHRSRAKAWDESEAFWKKRGKQSRSGNAAWQAREERAASVEAKNALKFKVVGGGLIGMVGGAASGEAARRLIDRKNRK